MLKTLLELKNTILMCEFTLKDVYFEDEELSIKTEIDFSITNTMKGVSKMYFL